MDPKSLDTLFQTLCRVESPFRHERRCADSIKQLVDQFGYVVLEDSTDLGPESAGNLLIRVTGVDSSRSVMFCAHIDTVLPLEPIDPVKHEGIWSNANNGILGADNKASVAALLWLMKGYSETSPPPIDIEVLLTVCEEDGLVGASSFDLSQLKSKRGYLFDSAGPVGSVVTASPTYYRLNIEIEGIAAHAGVQPEKGRSAVLAAAEAIGLTEWGRIDEQTTANVGRIDGGSSSTNVVPANCRVEAEVRSLDPEAAAAQVKEITDSFTKVANQHGCSLEVTTERLFTGYRHAQDSAAIEVASEALISCGYSGKQVVSGGGSDVNALMAKGFECVNLSNGTENNHRPDEYVSSDSLSQIVEVAKKIVEVEASSAVA